MSATCDRKRQAELDAQMGLFEPKPKQPDTPPLSTCKTCHQDKDVDLFPAYVARGKHYHRRECKECYNERYGAPRLEYFKQYRALHPDKRTKRHGWKGSESTRRRNVCKRRGIELHEYERLLGIQQGTCALCGKHPGQRNLCIDHNHKTGIVRSLLCNRCNLLLGHIENNKELVYPALQYLDQNDEPGKAVQ